MTGSRNTYIFPMKTLKTMVSSFNPRTSESRRYSWWRSGKVKEVSGILEGNEPRRLATRPVSPAAENFLSFPLQRPAGSSLLSLLSTLPSKLLEPQGTISLPCLDLRVQFSCRPGAEDDGKKWPSLAPKWPA